jgi:hypothetical protein
VLLAVYLAERAVVMSALFVVPSAATLSLVL